MKRKKFLESFLRALGAKTIEWNYLDNNKIKGTVIYDINEPEEIQDFVWYMTEENVPSESVRKTIDFLYEMKLISIDRIINQLSSSDLEFIEMSERENVLNELFNIEVRMVDDGIETDSFYLHY